MNNEDQIISLLTEIRDLLKPKEKKPVKRFVSPTANEVHSYCLEKSINGIDSVHFVNFYESKNWMIGKNKMKDWKAALRTWEKKNGSSGQRQNNGFDNRSRAQKVSDKLDEIAKRDIDTNGFTSELGGGSV